MSEVDKEFIREKIKLAGEYLSSLTDFLKLSDEDIASDLKSRYALERVFLLLVEEVIDMNNYFINTLELKPIDDLKSSFIALGDAGILPKDFASKVAPIAGVRNILVHQYEKLDFALFLKNLRANIGDFEIYFKHVLSYCGKN